MVNTIAGAKGVNKVARTIAHLYQLANWQWLSKVSGVGLSQILLDKPGIKYGIFMQTMCSAIQVIRM